MQSEVKRVLPNSVDALNHLLTLVTKMLESKGPFVNNLKSISTWISHYSKGESVYQEDFDQLYAALNETILTWESSYAPVGRFVEPPKVDHLGRGYRTLKEVEPAVRSGELKAEPGTPLSQLYCSMFSQIHHALDDYLRRLDEFHIELLDKLDSVGEEATIAEESSEGGPPNRENGKTRLILRKRQNPEFRPELWGIGREGLRWFVFKKNRSYWIEIGSVEPKPGLETKFLVAFLDAKGSLTGKASVRVVREQYVESESDRIFKNSVKPAMTRVRKLLTKALSDSKPIKLIQWECQAQLFHLRIKIGHAVRNERGVLMFHPVDENDEA